MNRPSRLEHLKNMLITYQRRLQILQQRQAKLGINTPPETIIEIEDLQQQFEETQQELTRLNSPLVYIHNFGDKEAVPAEATVLDWGDYFEAEGPRRTVPTPDMWQDELLPALKQVRQATGQRGLVRLRTTGALSVGFAFGHTFLEVGKYKLEVAQFPPEPPLYWYSDEPPPSGERAPRFRPRQIIGSQAAQDGVVIVYATPSRSPQSVCQAVAHHWGVEDGFAGLFSGEGTLEKLKGVLLLESAAAADEERFIEGWEAAALARSSRRPLIDFRDQVRPERLHLFLAVPFGLAVFLGHQWNAIGAPFQGYEWIGGMEYAPAWTLSL